VHFPAGSGIFIGLVIALQAVIVTYDGWYGAIYFVEEDQDPARNLPRSALGGALACMAIFVLVNVALLHVLPVAQIAASQIPAADAAMAIFGAHGKQIILIISLITAVSTINATILMSPRILFGMSRDGLFPRWLTSVNRGGTPTSALLLCTVASGAMILSGNFEALIAISAFLYVAVYISGFASLIVLRRREPDLARPFRAWGYPWTTWGVLLASAGFLIAAVVGDLKHSLFTLILIALSYPVYWLAVKKRCTG
jgi:APA family basic amino acid/polyamine antiporter